MRFIAKASEPALLVDFKKRNRQTPYILRFSRLTPDVRRELCDRMLSEQGWLCAYTMARIGVAASTDVATDFHMEHIQPQSRQPERDLDYDNIVLCAPGPLAPRLPYGAHKKSDADVDDDNFLSPLNSGCETRVRYRSDGKVNATDRKDSAAQRTVEILALNHPNLGEARLQTLMSFGLGLSARRPISAGKASRLAATIANPDETGRVAPFCQVADRFARRRQARAARISRSPGE